MDPVGRSVCCIYLLSLPALAFRVSRFSLSLFMEYGTVRLAWLHHWLHCFIYVHPDVVMPLVASYSLEYILVLFSNCTCSFPLGFWMTVGPNPEIVRLGAHAGLLICNIE